MKRLTYDDLSETKRAELEMLFQAAKNLHQAAAVFRYAKLARREEKDLLDSAVSAVDDIYNRYAAQLLSALQAVAEEDVP